MKTPKPVSAFLLGVMLQVPPMSVTAQDANPAVVIEWNELALNNAPAAAGPMVVRYYTLMHIAMFDAVNSIQRRSAKLWAAVEITNPNLMRVWDYVVRDVTLARRWSLIDAARLFAFVNVSINDSLLNTFTGKFSYGLWRPITATRRADEDLNDATIADAAWSPLVTSPPYPSYPGNMAGVGACAAKALELGIGQDNVAPSVTWTGINGNPNVTREYPSLSQLAQEEADSRIFAGIHFRFDNEVSQVARDKLVPHAYSKFMVPQ